MGFKENILDSYVNVTHNNTLFFIHDGTAANVQHSPTVSPVKSLRTGRILSLAVLFTLGVIGPGRSPRSFFPPHALYMRSRQTDQREMVAGDESLIGGKWREVGNCKATEL